MADPNGHRRLPAGDPGRGAPQFRPDSPPTGFPVEAAYSTFPAYGRAPLFASPFAVGETSGDCGVAAHLDQDEGFVGRNLFAGGDHLGATTPSALGHRWFGTPSAEYMPGPGAFPAVASSTHGGIWSSEPVNKRSRRHLLRKTKLCGPYMGGYCAVGSLCDYSHGAEEIRAVMPHSSAHYKTELCPTFTRGELCLPSLNCRFAHGKEELRPGPQHRHRTAPAAAHPGPSSSSSSTAVAGGAMGSSLIAPCDTRIGDLKTLLCKYDWRRGRSRHGDACDFAHGEEDQRIVPKEAGWRRRRRLCEELATKGWCKFGLNCKYSHGGAYRRRRSSSALGGRRSPSS